MCSKIRHRRHKALIDSGQNLPDDGRGGLITFEKIGPPTPRKGIIRRQFTESKYPRLDVGDMLSANFSLAEVTMRRPPSSSIHSDSLDSVGCSHDEQRRNSRKSLFHANEIGCIVDAACPLVLGNSRISAQGPGSVRSVCGGAWR